ncbi:meiotic helicase [Diplocarpon rosae]|nr:meiotic helicase [Diplocarpon rosae]
MDMQHDLYTQRIIQSASAYNIQDGRNAIFNQEGPDPRGWSFAPSRWRQRSGPEPPAFVSNFAVLAGLDPNDTRQQLQAPTTNRTRLTLPRSMYHQSNTEPEREPKTLCNADNHFRFAQNLQNGVPLNKATSRKNNTHSTDPVSPLVTAMLTQQRMPFYQQLNDSSHKDILFRQASTKFESVPSLDTACLPITGMLIPPSMVIRQPNFGQANFLEGMRGNSLNQPQPQKQQITPPFNLKLSPLTTLGGFVRSPATFQASQNSSPLVDVRQISSPTARVSLRRLSNRAAPIAAPGYSEVDLDTNEGIGFEAGGYLGIPQTPQRPVHPTTKLTARPNALSNILPMAHGIQLVSPYELPDRFRQVFPYELFNAVQSKCFASIYKTNDNVVVSAPTGSGKTALLELAICRLVEGQGAGQFKIVYQAPTKSLCSERMRDWSKKFSHINLPCAELTGDTSLAEMARVREASIIVTTPEKWDSITRKWIDHQKLVQMVKLFLIDEVHILKDTRGATLEAVVSRMKTIGANVRFVALSATVPNSEDIATWLGRDHTNHQIPAHRETFGEDFRPVRLQKHVHGYDGNFNDYAFEKFLDGKLPSLIRQYSQKKPIMVFCFTRKSCEGAATILAEWWTRQSPSERAWSPPSNSRTVSNRDLRNLITCGVSYHHAGLGPEDRHTVEKAFLQGDVNVICCTSTLAVGVNLPCHLVILKGTVGYQDGRLAEYSDLEVMQMLGRAGRPQFDDSAVAVIMTRTNMVDRYKKMMSGKEVLESTLHLNLIEHLNSEISLGTIKNTFDAKKWLCGTFFSVRMRQNPSYYKIEGVTPGGDADLRLEQICERDIKLLKEHKLVSEDYRMSCTEYGAAMSRYMVQFQTMKLLLGIPPKAKMEQILHILCQAVEFRDLRMKQNERPYLREFNKSPLIKYPIRETVTATHHKVSLVIQVQLGGIDDPTEKGFMSIKRQFGTDKNIIFERAQRLVRCVIDCKSDDNDSISTRHALDLARSLSAGFWEYSNLQLRQIHQIGPVATRKLVSKNVHSIEELAKMDTGSIERILSKNPPFGKKTRDIISGFPRLRVAAEIVGLVTNNQMISPKVNVKFRIWYDNIAIPVWNSRKLYVTFMAETTDGVLVHFWRGNMSKLEKAFEAKFSAKLTSPDVDINCWIACDEIVGTVRSCVLRHGIPASNFPKRPTQVESKKAQADNAGTNLDGMDEFGSDEVDDYEMLAAVDGIDKAKSDDYADEFIDIEEAELIAKAAEEKPKNSNVSKEPEKAEITREPQILEPFQMANGKWTCNHVCRNSQLLKNGQPCKHLCCREGLDKPRKIKRKGVMTNTTGGELEKTSKLRLASNYDSSDLDNVETIDLANVLSPVSYSGSAPREYRKLHKLHASVQTDKTSQRMTQKPKFSYASGQSPDLSFLRKDGSTSTSKVAAADDETETEFPSLSASLDPSAVEFNTDSDDPFTDVPITPRDHLPIPPATRPPSSFQNHSLDDSDASPSDLNDGSTMLRSPSSKVDSSFCSDLFDFAAFRKNADVAVKAPPSLVDKGKNNNQTLALSNAPKRYYSVTPDLPETKHRRVTHLHRSADTCHEASVPSWVNDLDSNLFNGIKDFVDFLD